jgi:hypothetical protein
MVFEAVSSAFLLSSRVFQTEDFLHAEQHTRFPQGSRKGGKPAKRKSAREEK